MPDESRPGALQYDGTPTALARRACRLLAFPTFLTLINTVMMGVFVLGPQLSPFLKQQWQQWRDARAQRKQRLAEMAVQKQCLDYAAPADKVVYEEDPDEGAKLLSADAADYEPAVTGSIRNGFGGANRGGFAGSRVPPGWRRAHPAPGRRADLRRSRAGMGPVGAGRSDGDGDDDGGKCKDLS